MTNATFDSNWAANYGGGIEYAGVGTSVVTGASFGGNSANLGGGALDIEGEGGSFALTGSTIANNTCASAGCGGGVTSFSGDYAVTFSVNASIIAYNLGSTTPSDFVTDGNISVGNSFIYAQGQSLLYVDNGNNDIVSDPMVDPDLTYYGGNYDLPIHILFAGSPAIDHISSFSPSTDQRGFPRGIKGGTSRTTLFDVGAMEYDPNAYQAETLTVVSSSETTVVVKSSGYSNSAGLELPATKVGDNVAFGLPIIQDATNGYDMIVNYATGPNAGIVQLEWSTDYTFKTGVASIGGTVDLYSSSSGFKKVDYHSLVQFDPDTPRFIRFRVTGRNSKNTTKNPSQYYVYLDYVQAIPK